VTDHQQLLSVIRQKDRRFRIVSYIYATTIVAGLCVLLIVGLVNLNRANAQLDLIQATGKVQSQQIHEVNQHIDRIAQFFTRTDRTSAAINDIDRCIITKN